MRHLRIAIDNSSLLSKTTLAPVPAEMKPTQSLQKTLRRLPLSPKQAGREYYKGNGVGSMGTVDKYGRFHPDYNKIRTFVYPAKGTKGFEVGICIDRSPKLKAGS